MTNDKILLMGNPNVGKSVFFTELTGIHAISSNYAGTTVSYTEGELTIGEKKYTLIDVPGTYSLTPTSEAETVATCFVENGAKAVICVLDASNLERNLSLALELQQCKIPTVYVLNMIDVAERHGISINAKLLERELGGPVVPSIAVKKQGLDELIKQLDFLLSVAEKEENTACGNCASCPRGRQHESEMQASKSKFSPNKDVWEQAREITLRVRKRKASKPSFVDKLGENMMKPMPGIPIAILVMVMVIGVVVGCGQVLRELLLMPFIDNIIVPLFRDVFTAIIPAGMFQNILIGEFGIFVISFEWILGLILPYVFVFYVAFTFLEDTGYLPRISVLFDNIMRKLGAQGGSLIHILMGYGCGAAAIVGSRAATSRKERIVISAAICFAVPCISQTGALISLLSGYAWWMMPVMILFSLILFIVATIVVGKVVKGEVDPLLIEVPNLLMPNAKAYGRKLLIRMKHFLKDAEAPMMISIVIVALLSESGLLAIIAVHAEPFVSGWLGLPPEAVVALILGIVRREMSVAPLIALNLSPLQAFVGGVVSLMYLPCLSVFAILVKEFKMKIALSVPLSTIILALFVGGLINHTAQLFL